MAVMRAVKLVLGRSMRLETLQGLECAPIILPKPGMSTSKTAPLNGSG